MRRSPALLLLLLASGCATNWERPGTGPAETSLFEEACRREAGALAPPYLVPRLLFPPRIEVVRHCRGGRCFASARQVPATWTQDDLNAPARAQFNGGCMAREGFAANGLRPLRLF